MDLTARLPDSDNSPHRLSGIDSLRGFAILLVMAYHFYIFGLKPAPSWASAIYISLSGIGWVGVDVFFVISGFLITGILYDSRLSEKYFQSFYFRRACRIFPLYYACLVFWFIAVPAVTHGTSQGAFLMSKLSLPMQLSAWTYLLNWFMAMRSFSAVPSFLQHFWSLSIEEQYYLVWPFLVRSLSKRTLAWTCCGLIAGSLVLRLGLLLAGLSDAAFLVTPARLDGLCIGGLLALAFRTPHIWSKAIQLAKPIAAAATLVSIASSILVGSTSSLLGLIFFQTASAGVLTGSVLLLLLSGRFLLPPVLTLILRFFSKYSYALYCFHQPIIVLLKHSGAEAWLQTHLNNTAAAIAVTDALALSSSVALAVLSWNVLEKRFLRLKNRGKFAVSRA